MSGRGTLINRRRILIAVVIIWVLITLGYWSRTSPAEESLVQYVGTIAATFGGVAATSYLGVEEYYRQKEEAHRERRKQLTEDVDEGELDHMVYHRGLRISAARGEDA